MLNEVRNEIFPFIPILRGRNDRMVPKGVQHLLGGELLWHKTQFNKRSHSILEEAIVNLIDVRIIVDGRTVAAFVVQTNFIVKDRMESNVFKSRGVLNSAKVLAIVV